MGIAMTSDSPATRSVAKAEYSILLSSSHRQEPEFGSRSKKGRIPSDCLPLKVVVGINDMV
jgi:hypothetical protein